MSVRRSDRLEGRSNNLNLVRMLAAVAVLVSHAFTLTGDIDPLTRMIGRSIGHFAIVVFFGISGLLIARSFERRATPWHWLAARVLRIFPGLLMALLITAFILGPITSELSLEGYFAANATWTYVPRNLSLAILQYPLPGVFENLPYGPTVNGSLWTLFYEAVCYAGLFALGTLGLLGRRRLLVGLLGAVFLAYLAANASLADLPLRTVILLPLAFPFMLGVVAHAWSTSVVLDWRIAVGVWGLAIPLAATPLLAVWIAIALLYSVLVFAFVPRGPLLAYNRLGDYSYGTYIYAFPCQQLAIWLLPGQGWAANIVLSLPLAVFFGILSWRLVEKPSLARVGSVAERIVTLRAPSLIERR